jgi:hypothetical protein
MSERNWRVWIDPEGIGEFTQEVTDLLTGVTIEHGRLTANGPTQPPRATLRLDNRNARFAADMARFKATYRVGARCRISIDVPANRWQLFKDGLRRRHRWLRWLRVRTVRVPRFEGPMLPWGS